MEVLYVCRHQWADYTWYIVEASEGDTCTDLQGKKTKADVD